MVSCVRVRVRVRVRLRLKKGPLGWLCRFRNTLMPLSVKITYINQSLEVWMATVRETTFVSRSVCRKEVYSVSTCWRSGSSRPQLNALDYRIDSLPIGAGVTAWPAREPRVTARPRVA